MDNTLRELYKSLMCLDLPIVKFDVVIQTLQGYETLYTAPEQETTEQVRYLLLDFIIGNLGLDHTYKKWTIRPIDLQRYELVIVLYSVH